MRPLLVSLYALGGAAILVGCADSRSSSAVASDTIAVGTDREAIIGGTLSTASQDATVLLTDQGEFTCTGTLIAPNLILTARHCVSELNEDAGQCGVVTSTEPPSNFGVVLGVDAPSGQSVATGAKLYTLPGTDMCGTDIALIQVDRDIPNAMLAAVRFTPVVTGETTVAVGYGADSDNQQADAPPQRLQRTGVTVQALGPAKSQYRTQGGKSLEVDLAQNELQTTESTCFGDSGGPLFDAQGQVIGVTSRGVDDLCVDRPTVWTGVAGYQKFISDAATAAGHPLAAATTTTPASTAAATTAGDDDDSSSTSSSSTKKKASTQTPLASASCSTSGPNGRGPSEVGLGVAMVGLALAGRRRRKA